MFDRLHWGAVASRDAGGLEQKDKTIAAKLMARESEPVLKPEQEQAIDEVVCEAEGKRRELGHLR